MVCGYNLSCVGDERNYSIIKSRYGDNLADKSLKSVLLIKRILRNIAFWIEVLMKDNIALQGLIYQYVHFVEANLENILNIIIVLIILN